MEKVSKQQICHKLRSFLPIILVLVLFSFFFFFSVSESSPSLLTTLIALLSTMFLVTLTRKKWSQHENLVQNNLQKLESHPSLADVTNTEVTQESEIAKRHERQAEAKPDTSLPLDSESCNCSIMDKSIEVNAQKKYEQHADPHSDSSLPSDSESSAGSIKSGSFENDHKRNQNLVISDSLAFDNDVDDDDEEEEEEDSLIEIKLPNSHFFGLTEDEEPKQNMPEFLPESIFKQEGLMELLAEINEINDDENLIEIDISMGSTKCQDLRVKQELACYGDQCVLSD